jgi:hypothetical protein
MSGLGAGPDSESVQESWPAPKRQFLWLMVTTHDLKHLLAGETQGGVHRIE